MEKKKVFLLCCMMLFIVSTAKSAYVKVVNDPSSTSAVKANTELIRLTENEHNQELDSIKDKQEKIAKYSATMESIKELYRMSMQNISGFGEESAYDKEMALEFAKVPFNTAAALKAMKGCPIINYINSLNEIANIQLSVIGIVGTFADVVNNGKISLSDFTSKKNDKLSQLLKDAHVGKKGDGYNFLDRYSRLTLCCTLISQIRDINMRLEQITYICRYCKSISNLVYSLDPDSWCDIMAGANIAESIIQQWNWEMGG